MNRRKATAALELAAHAPPSDAFPAEKGYWGFSILAGSYGFAARHNLINIVRTPRRVRSRQQRSRHLSRQPFANSVLLWVDRLEKPRLQSRQIVAEKPCIRREQIVSGQFCIRYQADICDLRGW